MAYQRLIRGKEVHQQNMQSTLFEKVKEEEKGTKRKRELTPGENVMVTYSMTSLNRPSLTL